MLHIRVIINRQQFKFSDATPVMGSHSAIKKKQIKATSTADDRWEHITYKCKLAFLEL